MSYIFSPDGIEPSPPGYEPSVLSITLKPSNAGIGPVPAIVDRVL